MDIMRQKVSFSGYAGLLPLLESYPVDVVDGSSPKRPDRIWDPPSILFSGYHGSFMGYSGHGVKLTTVLQLLPRLRMRGALPLPYAFMAGI